MSPEVGLAWRSGYRGQGTTITVLDNFGSNDKFQGNLTGKVQPDFDTSHPFFTPWSKSARYESMS
jgi:hypothetical protein